MPSKFILHDPRCRTYATRIRLIYTDARGRKVALLRCGFCGRRWIRLVRDVVRSVAGDPRKRVRY